MPYVNTVYCGLIGTVTHTFLHYTAQHCIKRQRLFFFYMATTDSLCSLHQMVNNHLILMYITITAQHTVYNEPSVQS